MTLLGVELLPCSCSAEQQELFDHGDMVAHLEPQDYRNLGAGVRRWTDPPWFLPVECHRQPDASFAHHHVLKGTGHAADEVLDQPGVLPPCAR